MPSNVNVNICAELIKQLKSGGALSYIFQQWAHVVCFAVESFEVIRLCEINVLANWPAAENTAKYT